MSEALYPRGSSWNAAPRTRATPPPPPASRCPFHSRAWGVRCEKTAGHNLEEPARWCVNQGDAFAPGYVPGKGETL